METNVLESLDLKKLGGELQQARQRAGMTQEDAAKALGVARTTVTAIEKGDRRIRADELLKLAQAYGRQVSDFVRKGPSAPAFVVQFRGPAFASEEDRSRIAPTVDDFERLCHGYLELELLVGSPLVRNYPREYTPSGLPIDKDAESAALQERARLGLGDGPLPPLRDLLEQDVGMRLFYLSMPSQFSELYAFTDGAGACMAINRDHPEARRRWSMTHAYGHFLRDRYRPRVSMVGGYQRRPESEQFADAFAELFLMPTSGLTRRFADVRRAAGKFTLADVITFAHYYGVSVEAMALRLEQLGLIPTGTWDHAKSSSRKVHAAQRELGLGPLPAREDRLPVRYVQLALQALREGQITEPRFARLLGTGIVEAREIAESFGGVSGAEELAQEEAPQALQLER